MGDFTDDGMSTDPQGYDSKSYALNGKIMLTAMVILFAVVILIVCLHVYGRWFLLRAGRRHHLRHGRRRTRIVFFSSPTSSAPSGGLDASVLKSLPTFVYSSSSIPDDVLECAVCLSEFEENEKGRLLPKCNHRFHIGCIDMWFDSHSTCPLCRAPVNAEIPAPASDSAVEIVVPLGESPETDAGSTSGVCPSCLYENEMGCSSNSSSSAGSSSIGNHRKPFELVNVSIEVPRRNESFKGLKEEVGLGSPAGQGFKSPGSRILSLKRILSRDRKAATSSATTVNCSSATEIDLEKGEEEQRTQSQSR